MNKTIRGPTGKTKENRIILRFLQTNPALNFALLHGSYWNLHLNYQKRKLTKGFSPSDNNLNDVS